MGLAKGQQIKASLTAFTKVNISLATRLTLLKSHTRYICNLRNIGPTCTYGPACYMCVALRIHYRPRVERLEPVFSISSLYEPGTYHHNIFSNLSRVVSAISNGRRIRPLYEHI